MAESFRQLIEAALFISGRPLTIEELARICNSGNIGTIRQTVEELCREYAEKNSGIEIYETEGRYLMKVKKELEDKVQHLAPETDMPPAVLKTLALIAYSQPIKQSDIIKIRGTGAYKYIRKLKEQELIETQKISRTKIITVTNKFKEYFQIKDIEELKQKIKPATVFEQPPKSDNNPKTEDTGIFSLK